jgi:hypothetical protein
MEISGRRLFAVASLIVFALAISPNRAVAAEHYGQVTIDAVPIPGATVTATQGDQRFVTVTDQEGVYRLADLADGVWTIRVEMLGFATVTKEITVGTEASTARWELALLPFDTIVAAAKTSDAAPVATQVQAQQLNAGASVQTPSPSGFQRAGVNANAAAVATIPSTPPEETNGDGIGAADGFLINGSVNNGAASPFAQLRAFGNNRPGQRSLYNGGIGILSGNSVWDARPYSFAGQQASKPSYNDVHVLGSFGGPLKIPGLTQNRPTVFVGYQRTSDHNASAQSALMPTLQERTGDLSQTRITIVDPTTGRPFPGNVIPSDRISPQAAALLGYYPQPNLDTAGRYNFQTPVVSASRQDNIQTRVNQPINTRNQLFGTVAYQRTTTDSTSLFGFQDSAKASGIDTAVNWSHRFGPLFSMRLRYQFTRVTNRMTPHFSELRNVSGEAGIVGNNQDPVNWGPPSLIFAGGVAGLADAQYGFTNNKTNGGSAEIFWSRRGRHNFTFGGGVRRNHVDIQAQQEPRGTFAFTGVATGSDLADFLLGIPSTSSIAFGNADKHLRATSYDAYLSDDWRVSASLTVNAGLRWEYEAPLTERFGRLANLDITSGFAAIKPVVAGDPVGALTGQPYPDSLIRPDKRGVQPRIGVSWRPIPGSSTVIRGGYGIYRNTSVYQSIMTLLAQQPPLSTTFSVANSQAHPLTLANGFVAIPGGTTNTFAVDPDFRVGYAHNWQISMQRDLPQSLTIIATYLGTKGSHLMQELLPNTYPSGTANPCPTCPTGFVYLTSNGSSSKHAGQVQLRRRLRNGLTATVQYTVSKAEDDAAAFSGAALTGASIAQDWSDLEAERGPSNFDQRHVVTTQFEYTTGVGVSGGALLDGIKGSLWKGWTFTSQLTTGSGLPLTPVYVTFVPGTGVTGTVRADTTGESTTAPSGFYVNPAAYAPPAAGHWGTAGRNSVRGPAQFLLNAGISRTFPRGRLNLDWRIDATNVLNRVTFASVNTIVGSPQFGLPDRANPMRKLQTSLRLRF